MAETTVRRREREITPQSAAHSVNPAEVVGHANLRCQRQMVRAFSQVREDEGLSEEELGNQLGADAQTVLQIENFEYNLNLTEIRHIALALRSFVKIEVVKPRQPEHTRSMIQTVLDLLGQNALLHPGKSGFDLEDRPDERTILKDLLEGHRHCD